MAVRGKVDFLGLDSEFASIRDDALSRIHQVLESQSFVLGGQTVELETAIAAIADAAHAVACSSGSDALYLALLALGIGAGDAVVVPSFTFFATAGAVARAGAVPVMADVDTDTLNMDAACVEAAVEREFRRGEGGAYTHTRSGARLRAIIAVHLYGRAAPLGPLADTARDLGLALIEDAAQALGARSQAGAAGGVGDIGCFSFYPTKNLGGAGDSGMLTTQDDALAERLRSLRVHGGASGSYRHEEVGINARMSEIQAAYLNAKLPYLEAWTRTRRAAAAAYHEGLAALEADTVLTCLPTAAGQEHVYHQFVVKIGARRERARVMQVLAEHGVESRIFYPLPLHLQPCFAGLGYRKGDLPVSERAADEVVALPIGIHIDADSVTRVCAAMSKALDA